MKCCGLIIPDVTGHTPSFYFLKVLLLTGDRISSQESWGSWQCFMGKSETSFCVVLVSSGFRHGTVLWMPFLPICQSYCWSMTTDLSGGQRGLQFFQCCSGFFCDHLDESLMCSWIRVGRLATPRTLHHSSTFSPDVNDFVFNLLKNFFKSFSLLHCERFLDLTGLALIRPGCG